MTGYQPPYDPRLSYASYQPSPRPTSVTAMSIVAIIFGSLGVLCGALGLVGQLFMLAMGGKNPLAPNIPAMTNTALTAYHALAAVINLALSVILLVGGIGGLKLWPPARRMMMYWSIALILWATILLIVQLLWELPETQRMVQQMQSQMGTPSAPGYSSMTNVFHTAQMIGVVVAWLLEMILPICFLTLWRSPRVVAAFEGGAVPPLPVVPPQGNYPM